MAAPGAIIPLPSRTYVSADGTLSYTLRSLLQDDGTEIENWCQFCASVFADKKPTPPSSEYFRRHYFNDPNRQASLIRVATIRQRRNDSSTVEGEGDLYEEEIVASCRVFLRRIYVREGLVDVDHGDHDGHDDGGEQIKQQQEVDVGGIGEVCTSPSHRRMGLSRELLRDCFVMMKDQARLSLSFLHAATSFFPVYEGVGYRLTSTSWTVVPYDHELRVSASSTEDMDPSIRVRLACFPNDTEQLSRLYTESYSSVSGCLVRNTEYWESYLAQEWKDRMWVATASSEGRNDEAAASTCRDGPILGWIVTRFRGSSGGGTRRVQICDLGLAPPKFLKVSEATRPVPNAAEVFDSLLHRAVKELCRAEAVPVPHVFDVVLPTLTMSRISCPGGTSAALDWSRSFVEIDEGWMYKTLVDDNAAEAAAPVWERIRSDPLHLMWPADSF